MDYSLKLIPVESTDPQIKGPLLIKNEASIGRGEKSDIKISDMSLSKLHLRIIYKNENYYIEDANSRNGTFLNKSKITQLTELKNGDELVIGKNIFKVEIERPDTTQSYDSLSFSDNEESLQEPSDTVKDPHKDISVSQELDRRMLDDYLEDDLKDTGSQKTFPGLGAGLNKKLQFSSLVIGTKNYLKNIRSEDLKKSPAFINFAIFIFMWFAVTGYIQNIRLAIETDGMSVLSSFTVQTSMLVQSLLYGTVMLVAAYVFLLIFSSVSWIIFKSFRFNFDFNSFIKIVCIALLPAVLLMFAGSLLILLLGNLTLGFFAPVKLAGIVIMLLGCLYFEYLFYIGLKSFSKDINENRSREFKLLCILAIIVSFVMFAGVIYDATSWSSEKYMKENFEWEEEFSDVEVFIASEEYSNAINKLEMILKYEKKLSDEEKADAYFWTGIMQILMENPKKGEKNIDIAFSHSGESQKEAYFGVMAKYDFKYKDDEKKYKVINALHKSYDNVMMQILLDIKKYENKYVKIKNLHFKNMDFGFSASIGFDGCDPWFVDPQTVILKQSEFLQSKNFIFYFQPSGSDRESRKFVLKSTNKEYKSFFVQAIRGKLIKHRSSDGKMSYIFLIIELEIKDKKYTGNVPQNLFTDQAEIKEEK